ncbi:N-alpha-acetyltransferase 35, NatC auxiliary subunit [Geosmithia morbida]|uniref:N-alpha-acetyltransferase 35, NatC auxiliary subunit n=1 Tax=Geosmithia morbida TaxID=1094350 RepID=A0A9P5D6T5_9HYPO|nr:N-alpha-acetyltransferase 35, NatC auxiliary subunit [Geosmithia morbida]KAF4123844.1 N-alpha-acetyltransferase 35, NatC auxiliary subunit [Geosmithia morbida]
MAVDYGVGASDEIARLSLGNQDGVQGSQAPRLDSQGIIPVDVTDRFFKASKLLQPGEVIKDGFFTLFESVGALEVMDPKMDSGCVAAGEEFDETYDVSRPLLPEEVLGIIDQLLCHEMSWHLGYPLSQTVFTSVYVEALLKPDPHGIDEAKFLRRQGDVADEEPMLRVLRAYCLGMLKACGYVNDRVRNEHSYEEEDFVTNTYNRSLLSSVSTASIRHAIADAVDLLQRERTPIGNDDIVEALSNRLILRDIFLSAAECPQYVDDPDTARKPWTAGIALLPAIQRTHALGKPVDESFSVKLQRKLASTVPPRPIVQLSFDDAFGHLSRLFQDGQDVITVLNYTNTQCLLTFVFSFQAKKPQPLVYVRSLLQTFLFDAMEMLGSMSIRQIIDDDLSTIVLPASPLLDRDFDEIEAVHDPRFVIAQKMELFRQRAAQPYLDILRTFCQNRCRVRRTLCHTVRSWDALQADAEEIDQLLRVKTQELVATETANSDGGGSSTAPAVDVNSWPLSAWTYLYKLRQMEWVVQLGFELEVYQPDEFGGMYWYLNFLSKQRLEYSPRIKSHIVRRVEALRQSRPPHHSAAEEKQLQRSLAYIRLSLLDAAVTWELSDGLSCLYTVLGRLGLIKPPPRPYSDDGLRYELRMKPFTAIGVPELPSFADFTRSTHQPDVDTLSLLDDAARALASSKKGFESLGKLSAEESFSVGSHDRWLAAVRNGLKSCIAATLAVTTLQKALQASGDGEGAAVDLKLKAEVPTPDRAYHDWWIVPKLVPIA